MSVVFGKLCLVRRLDDAGASSRPQAEAPSGAFHRTVAETVATKADVDASRSGTQADVLQTRTALQHEIGEVREHPTHETFLCRSEMKAALAEDRVWTVGAGASIIAVPPAIKYLG